MKYLKNYKRTTDLEVEKIETNGKLEESGHNK